MTRIKKHEDIEKKNFTYDNRKKLN